MTRTEQIELTPELYREAQARGLTLTELLEERDPSDVGSPLDAFERQLCRLGINLSGPDVATVERFFGTTASTVLFPEWVAREARAGKLATSVLNNIVAQRTRVNSDTYKTLYLSEDETDRQLRVVGEGAELPMARIGTTEHTITLKKFGRYISATYEAVRRKSVDVLGLFLRRVGMQIEVDKTDEVIGVIIDGDGNANGAEVINTDVTGAFDYDDLVKLWNEFHPYTMDVILANKDMLRRILAMDEFKDPLVGFGFQKTGKLVSPMGCTLLRVDSVPDGQIIGLDSRFSVEEIYETDVITESERLIRNQFEGTAISEVSGFAKVFTEASKVMDMSWS